MPGVVGLIGRRPPHESVDAVKEMLRTLNRQGSYQEGIEAERELGVCVGWVAHKESFTAALPFKSQDGKVTVLLSGECFPDSAPRCANHRLDPGKGNGEWITELYERFGEGMFERLNGMFSGILIDSRERKVFLFNDRYGAERVYWHQAQDGFYFASEAKGLLQVLPGLREFDQEGVAQFLTFGCTIDWRTLFRGIEILPGGSCWKFQDQICRKQRYFHHRNWEDLPSLSPDSFQERFDDTFKRILPRYFRPDSTLGIALTGGLDTRMILSCEPTGFDRPISYTFTGRSGETFDDRVAAEVAEASGLEHQLLRLGPDFFSEFATHADETIYVTDGAFGVTGAHEIYFSRKARQLALVRLTGLFGSEILRGVSTFKPLPPSSSLLDPEFAKVIEALVRNFRSEQFHPVTSAAFRNIPWNLFGSMAANRSQLVLRSPYLDNEIVELAYQAPDELRKSPKVALRLIQDNCPRLARIPTDRRVEDKGATFPRNFRHFLKEVGFKIDYYHNEGMPNWFCRFDPLLDAVDARLRIFGHHKFLHYRSWFRNDLSSYVREVLSDPRTQRTTFFSRKSLAEMARAHTEGYGNYVLPINAALTLEAVERLFFQPAHRKSAEIGGNRGVPVPLG